MIERKSLVALLQELIRIDSQNPPGDESRIGAFVSEYLKRLGIKPKIYAFKKRRPNVVGIIAGRRKNRSLLITPHLDTVPAGKNWRFPPLAGKVLQNKIYGLGATDCKGNLAASLAVIKSLIDDRLVLDYRLVFAATAEEESGSSLGLIPLLEKGILKVDAALVLDADNFQIIVTQKGLIHLKVEIQGRRAHGAYPWQGSNAIDIAINILRDLKAHRFAFSKNSYLRAPTLNIGTIKGGDKVNVVADWCEFELDFRFLPGMSAEKILKIIKRIIQRYSRKFKIEIEGIQKPYAISKDHSLVECLGSAMRKLKIKPLVSGSEGATTITFFQEKGIPAIATGFGEEACAHAANEYIKIDNLYKGALVLEEFLKNYRFAK